jgi:hypothetical protein
MTKLIVQIPCYNEEKTLPQTLRDIPPERLVLITSLKISAIKVWPKPS